MSNPSSNKIRSGRAVILVVGLFLIFAAAVIYAVKTKPIDLPVLGSFSTQPPSGFFRVTEVADGDTIVVDMNGTAERIRMIGVDTPETHHPEKPVQCFGVAASNFTQDLLENKNVRLESDPENTNRDHYNRLLRYVYTESDELVNKKLIEDGYGFAYTSFPFTKLDEFRQAEDTARQAGRGLWSGCQPTLNEFGGYSSEDEL